MGLLFLSLKWNLKLLEGVFFLFRFNFFREKFWILVWLVLGIFNSMFIVCIGIFWLRFVMKLNLFLFIRGLSIWVVNFWILGLIVVIVCGVNNFFSKLWWMLCIGGFLKINIFGGGLNLFLISFMMVFFVEL